MSLNYVLALILITSPKLDLDDAKNYNSIAAEIQSVAINLEIMDKRERAYIMEPSFAQSKDSFIESLKVLRERYDELKDAPPLNDYMRFPDKDLINELLVFNRQYYSKLSEVQSLYPFSHPLYRWHEDAMKETDKLYEIWDYIRDTKPEYYYVTVRRRALKKIREELGFENYYNGYLPPYVPIWRFRKIN